MSYVLSIGLIVGVIAFFSLRRYSQKEVIKLICLAGARRNGEVRDVPGQAFPVLHFLHRGADVTVMTHPGSRFKKGTVEVHMKCLTYRNCTMSFNKPSSLGIKFVSPLKRVMLGSPFFDQKVILKTDEEMIPKQIIIPSIQNMILEFDAFPLGVTLKKESFVTTIHKIPMADRDYDRLIEITLMLYERLRGLN